MPKKNRSRSGSLGFKPKVRAERIYPDIDNWEETDELKPLGFAGYKVGMSRVMMIDDTEGATQGQEVAEAVTILEAPPLRVYGARFYTQDVNTGKNVFTEAWTESPAPELQRAVDVPKEGNMENLEKAKENSDKITDVRLLVHTQPGQAGLSKKTAENFEVGIGGDVEDQLEYAEEMIGKQIEFDQVFEEGEYSDVVAVTKGKGMEGPVQRYGIKKLGHKTQKKRRKAGNVGPWHPDTLSWKVPLPGQQGFNNRTEVNKRILAHGEDPEDVQRDGGFNGYGEVQSNYIIIKGSVPGPSERLIRLRTAMREDGKPGTPEITYIDQ
ncbi:50S ribosomal protein L3 [Candidatus Nanohalovita haloferacivicina]|uniref:50S ribosomal protein L3 n=1 Tax=Candidatus Nanohalovita haloferacivicina TaxID=2978046 RepID=UPI00325FAC26|nr:Ribosomal protein L3 [Candidatus Nanohalobia archaeon BNXNv]